MQCVAPNCDQKDSSLITSQEIKYFKFPFEPSLRDAWLETLRKPDWQPDEDSAVCSKHFLPEDFVENSHGLRTLRDGALPTFTVQVCRVCFSMDCKLYPLTAYKALCTAYETLTGLLIQRDNIPPYLCNECAHHLLKCARFQKKSLEAHSIFKEIATKHNCIPLESIKIIQGNQNPLPLNEAHKQCQTYDIEMEIAEIEETEKRSLSKFCKEVIVDCIKLECDESVNQETINDKSLAYNVMVHISEQGLQEDTGIDSYKAEDSGAMNHEKTNLYSKNDDISKETEDDAMDESTRFEDEKQDAEQSTKEVQVRSLLEDENPTKPDTCSEPKNEDWPINDDTTNEISLGIEKENYKQTIGGEQEFTNIPEHLNDKAVDTSRKPLAEGTLLNNKFSCDICNFETNIDTQLMSHLKAHAANKSYNCSVCNYKTVYKRSYTWHMRVHSGEKPYSCDVCNKAYTRKSHLQIHVKDHLNEKPYICDLCKKGFSRKDSLKVHLKNHSGEKPYSCDVCNKTFGEKCTLKKHYRTHSGEKPYLCHICVKSFTGKDHLEQHLWKHSGEKPFSCNVCNKKFISNDSLQKHLHRHSNIRPYSCDVCSKTFVTKSNLKTHCRIHFNDKPYFCQVCKKTFSGIDNITAHLKIHPIEKPYSCGICNKTFAKKFYFERHIKVHSEVKHYSCNLCNKIFITKGSLTEHIPIHSGEKPYSCTICNKEFTMKRYLRKHMRKHSGNRPYSCDICKKSFTTKDYILIHMRVHTGERPYACQICNKAFTRKNHLQNHTGTSACLRNQM